MLCTTKLSHPFSKITILIFSVTNINVFISIIVDLALEMECHILQYKNLHVGL